MCFLRRPVEVFDLTDRSRRRVAVHPPASKYCSCQNYCHPWKCRADRAGNLFCIMTGMLSIFTGLLQSGRLNAEWFGVCAPNHCRHRTTTAGFRAQVGWFFDPTSRHGSAANRGRNTNKPAVAAARAASKTAPAARSFASPARISCLEEHKSTTRSIAVFMASAVQTSPMARHTRHLSTAELVNNNPAPMTAPDDTRCIPV